MKLNFKWSEDGQVHAYCIVCHNETVERHWVENRKHYYCSTCDKIYPRWIKIDPGITYWIADDGEYWHESSGVFVRNADRTFLFYRRRVFPFLWTVPSGHVDKGETAIAAAQRELKEEVDLEGHLLSIATEDIKEDPCSMGADAHVWHVFLLKVDNAPLIRAELEEVEDNTLTWLALDKLDDALKGQLTSPVRHIIQRYGDLLANQ